MNQFETLLMHIGDLLGTTLKADSHQSCRIRFHDLIEIQLDLSDLADEIIAAIELAVLPAGSLRLSVLTHALMFNGSLTRCKGFLSFSGKKESLVLWNRWPLDHLDADKLFAGINTLTTHAHLWVNALKNNTLPTVAQLQDP